MANEHLDGWRQWVRNMAEPAASSFTPATPGDYGPITFRGDRSPDDAAALLPEAAATKMIAIEQRFSDLSAQVPTFEEVREIRVEMLGHANRISDLTRHASEGGFGLDASAPQVVAERRKLERAEKEFARRTELKETRTVRSTATGQLRRSLNDWVLRGIPGGCIVEPIGDAPLAELLKKGETLSDGVSRYRLRQRELDADAHRVNSQQWPISMGEADARALVGRRAEAGRPLLEAAIENGQPISFATTRLTGLVHNVDARGAVAFIDAEDAVGLVCWLFGPELLKKVSAGFREIGDDTQALDQQQRETMLATISADRLIAERSECSLIWVGAERGEIIDFRADTTPMAALGVSLRTVPRAPDGPSSPEHAYDLVQPGGGRR